MKVKGTFIAAALAFRLPSSNWEVYCNECLAEIGVMNSDTLFRAIMLTAGRGGVKCPTCRDKTCDYCGLTLEKPRIYLFRDNDGERRICGVCVLEYASEELVEVRPVE